MPSRNRSAAANENRNAALLANAEAAAANGQEPLTGAARPPRARPEIEGAAKLARKRLQDFAALFACAMLQDDPKTVHDLRVASRRMQQLLRGLASDKKNKVSKKASSFLRSVRQALGPLRNLDVMMELVDARASVAASERTRAAWLEIKTGIEKQRARESKRAQEILKGYDLTGFIDRTRRAMQSPSAEGDIDDLNEVIERRFQAWSEALAEVGVEPTAKRLHSLRIAGKRLRYSVELGAALTDPKLKNLARSLARLQDNLGAWHDVHTLLQYVANYINQQQFLAQHPGESRLLLAEMEREQKRGQAQANEAVVEAEALRTTWPIKSEESDE